MLKFVVLKLTFELLDAAFVGEGSGVGTVEGVGICVKGGVAGGMQNGGDVR